MTINLLSLLGIFAIFWPIVPLRHNIKNLPWSVKWTPVIMFMVGCSLTWDKLSPEVPVITNADVQIVKIEPHRLTVNLTMYQARSCSLKGLSVFFVDKKGEFHEGIVNMIKTPDQAVSKPRGTLVYPRTLVVSVDGEDANSMFFRTSHKCALGYEVPSEFGYTKTPDGFS